MKYLCCYFIKIYIAKAKVCTRTRISKKSALAAVYAHNLSKTCSERFGYLYSGGINSVSFEYVRQKNAFFVVTDFTICAYFYIGIYSFYIYADIGNKSAGGAINVINLR